MTYEEILELSAALLNDQERDVYTNIVLLPYLNMARMELEEVFELNNIPVTNEASALITIPTAATELIYGATLPIPSLPVDLVEIQELFESGNGLNSFSPMRKVDFIGHPNTTSQRSYFGEYAWSGNEITFNAATVPIDIKINYIRSLFTALVIGDITDENNIRNTSSYFQYRVAGLACEFIGENTTRAGALNGNAGAALERSLGISVKGRQVIFTRRRPFRAAYKRRRVMI